MKNKLLVLLAILFFLFSFVIFFKGLNNSTIYTPELKKNISLTNFEAKEFFSDQKISSNELFTESNFYLINIWSSWCVPCRDEHPFLLKLQNDNKAKLIGINYKDNKKNALKFIEELSNPFDKILSDENGTLSIKLGAYGVPESFLIDRDKKILKKIVGPIDQKSYSKIIEILNETN